MSYPNTDPPEAPVEDDQSFTIDIKGLDAIEDPALKGAIINMQSQLAEMKRRDDDRVKAETKLREDQYNLDRTKVLDELRSISPKIAEINKDKHKNDIEIALETAKMMNPNYKSFDEGGDAPEEPKKVLIGFDRVKKENIYK